MMTSNGPYSAFSLQQHLGIGLISEHHREPAANRSDGSLVDVQADQLSLRTEVLGPHAHPAAAVHPDLEQPDRPVPKPRQVLGVDREVVHPLVEHHRRAVRRELRVQRILGQLGPVVGEVESQPVALVDQELVAVGIAQRIAEPACLVGGFGMLGDRGIHGAAQVVLELGLGDQDVERAVLMAGCHRMQHAGQAMT